MLAPKRLNETLNSIPIVLQLVTTLTPIYSLSYAKEVVPMIWLYSTSTSISELFHMNYKQIQIYHIGLARNNDKSNDNNRLLSPSNVSKPSDC